MLILVCFSFYFIVKALLFMKQKTKENRENSKKIMEFCKDLFDYPLFGSIGWIIGFPLIFLDYSSDFSITGIRLYQIVMLLSKFFMNLKGFLYLSLFLSSKKVKTIVHRFFEEFINRITNQDAIPKPKKIVKEEETEDENNINK